MILIIITSRTRGDARESRVDVKNERDKLPTPHAGTAGKGAIEIHSRALFGAHRQIRIIHNDDQYILRITANDKLILTK
jgi:hemin uptake protein HemP